MLLYEKDHSEGREYFFTASNINMKFPKHLHRSFELIYVSQGTLQLQIGQRWHTLTAGNAALILPGQVHAYASAGFSENHLCIFSEDFVPDFYRFIRTKTVEEPVFALEDARLIGRLCSKEDNRFSIKAMLYAVAGQFVNRCAISEPKAYTDTELLERTIIYVQEHFTEKITLNTLAQSLGYHYNYLSAYLNEHLGMHFCEFVNLYRIDYACELLQVEGMAVSDIAQKCGFETIRSFNRNFKLLQGCTPMEYRARRVAD